MAILTTSGTATLTAGQIGPAIMAEMLKNGEIQPALDMALSTKTHKAGSGKSVQFRRYPIPAVDTTVETEGVNKAIRALTTEDYTGTLDRYAEALGCSTMAHDLEPWDVVKAQKDNLKELVARTREKVRWNTVIAGNNVLYNSSAITSRGTVNGAVSAGPLEQACRLIDRNRGRYFLEASNGSNKEGTTPIEAAYLAFCHTDLKADLRALPGFTTCDRYGGMAKHHPLEFGSFRNIRFICGVDYSPIADAGAAAGTTFLSTTGTSLDVYPIVILAKDAVDCVKLAGSGEYGYGNLHVEHLGKADKSDYSNARQVTVATWYDLVMWTNHGWGCRVEVAATRNPS